MTSMAAESVATILVSCKQTRFHIESPNYRELDIEGLNITVQSSAPPAEGKASSSSAKGKGKAVKGEGTEILNNAKLRLKAGSRYALIGRNGSGKSTLLRAIAEKLIPGIPEKTRISILQQTNAGDANTDEDHSVSAAGAGQAGGPTVLEDVVDKATAKSELEQEINFLTNGVNSEDAYGALRAVRKIRHERMQKRLFVLDKDARLRSGARGLQARKALVEYEKAVAESAALNGQPAEDITPSALQAETQEAVDMLAELQLQVEPSRLADIESQAKNILLGLGFSEAYLARPASSLSGGWQMRKALATCLLQSETDILILDEPTNFLDLLGILWLQRYLQSLSESEPDSSPTLILVSHDRDFVSLCTDLLILRDKSLSYFHGSLPTYEESQSERRVYLSKMKDAQDKQKAHIQDTIQKNMAAGRKNDDQNKMRQAKSRQKKIDDRWGMQTNAKGGRFKLNRDMAGFHLSARADIDIPDAERSVHVLLPEPMELRFPGALISLENVAFRYPSPPNKGKGKAPPAAPDTLQDITLSVGMGDRIGILGLNGAGKSTLIKLLVDDARPTRGTATRHPRLKLGYYSQHAVENLQKLALAELDSTQKELTALALLSREVAGELDEGEIRGLLGSLGLPGRIASDVPVRKLSGGQLVRCELARILWKRPHCLVLDEVTTHLDYETVTALREALRGWAGAVVLVSHDRWFMRGAIEGIIEDTTGSGDSGDDGDGSEDEKEALRRRVVYRLKAGKLVRLEGGVQEFEDVMERRAKKLLAE